MAVTSIFYNGRVISVPGSYSEVDASGLEQVGLGASGIVALIGTAEGGKPVAADDASGDFLSATRPQKVRDLFRSGELREAGAVLFDPSRDADITAGAQKVIFMKTNLALQSTVTFSNALGTAMLVTSADYGAFTEQINLEIANGTERGKLITVRFESDTESADDVGGAPTGGTADEMFTLTYLEPAGLGWDTMNAQVVAAGIRANGTRDEAGLDGDVLAAGTNTKARVVSSAAGDTTQNIWVYGLVGGTPTREKVKLAGTTPVLSVNVFDAASIRAGELDVACVGTVLITDTVPTTIISIAPAALAGGGVRGSTMFVANQGLNMVADGATTKLVWLVGKNAAGAVVIDRVTLAGAVHASSAVVDFTEILFIVMGDVEAARTVTINGVAVQTSNSVQDNITKALDLFNSKQVGSDGFTMVLVTGLTAFKIADLDLTGAAVDIDNPVTAKFYAELFFTLDYLTNSVSLVTASRIAFAPKIDDIVIDSVVDSTTYTVTIDATAISFTSDGSATLAEIQAGLVAAINAHGDINQLVTAAVNASAVRVTADSPLGFAISESDGNLSLASIQVTAGVGQIPDNTSVPVFLSGGTEGASTFAEVQLALNLLKQVRVNSIVVMSADPAVHAAVIAHCDFMGGIGRSERDGFVGLLNSAMTGLPSKTEIKSQIVDLNTRHLRAFAQDVGRFSTAGEAVVSAPAYQACVAAGMQAGSSVGTSLTFKYANVTSVVQHSSWNPIDDAEEMVNSGLCFMEAVDGVGRRFVRNVTTYLQDANLAFIEGSVNEAVNFFAFNFRTNMEFAVGKKGFAGTVNAGRAVAINTLGLLVDTEILVAYQALSVELFNDVMEVEVEGAPVIPINFVKNTIHLVTIRQSA